MCCLPSLDTKYSAALGNGKTAKWKEPGPWITTWRKSVHQPVTSAVDVNMNKPQCVKLLKVQGVSITAAGISLPSTMLVTLQRLCTC